MNLLLNGGFEGNLDRWAGSGTIARNLGYPRLGCVLLTDGQTIFSETLGFAEDYPYQLHYFYRLGTGATLTAGAAGVTQQHTGAPLDVWREGTMIFALDTGANGQVSFGASGGTVYVDSVTLVASGLAITRAGLASLVAARLATLGTDAALSRTPDADGPEGDYTAAIDQALRALGALSRWGDPDVTQLAPAQVDDAADIARTEMLQILRAIYAKETDVKLGPRSESRSQIAGSIDRMLSGSAANRRIQYGRLLHSEWLR